MKSFPRWPTLISVGTCILRSLCNSWRDLPFMSCTGHSCCSWLCIGGYCSYCRYTMQKIKCNKHKPCSCSASWGMSPKSDMLLEFIFAALSTRTQLAVGVTAGFWLLLLSGVLFAASIVVAWSASCLATGKPSLRLGFCSNFRHNGKGNCIVACLHISTWIPPCRTLSRSDFQPAAILPWCVTFHSPSTPKCRLHFLDVCCKCLDVSTTCGEPQADTPWRWDWSCSVQTDQIFNFALCQLRRQTYCSTPRFS